MYTHKWSPTNDDWTTLQQRDSNMNSTETVLRILNFDLFPRLKT